MKKIEAKIVADSVDPRGNRITTMLLTFPRFILAELNTHRMFSKNSASSRAIPFEKMLKMVNEDPFVPIAWQKNHSGMQGIDYITNASRIEQCVDDWLEARDDAVNHAMRLNKGFHMFEDNKVVGYDDCVTKQICNRLLEPFMWHTVLLTGTEFKNFFELRCPRYEYYDMLTGDQQFFKSRKGWLQYYDNKPLPKAKHINKIPENDVEWLQINHSQAEIHMQALAEAMYDAYNESTPKLLQRGEWHIPFGDKLLITDISDVIHKAPYKEELNTFKKRFPVLLKEANEAKIKVSVARCARLSYMTFDGKVDYEKDIELHDKLLTDEHWSAFEHCARVMTDTEYFSYIKGTRWMNGMVSMIEKDSLGCCNNFRGFIQYRYLVENNLNI